MDYFITEIVRKASDHLVKKKQVLQQKAYEKENNNLFLNEVTGKHINKFLNR